MDARQVNGDDRGRSVPGRLGRHRVVINPSTQRSTFYFLAFWGVQWGGISRYGASRGYQAIQSQTEPYRSNTGPFRAIYQAIVCDISPSTVFSRRRSFPLRRASIIVVALPRRLSSSPSVAHVAQQPSPPLFLLIKVTRDHHRCQVSWHLSHSAAPSTQQWQPWRQVVVFSGGYWLLLDTLPYGYAAR